MRASILFTLALAACGVLAAPIPAPEPVALQNGDATGLEERSTLYHGTGTWFRDGLGACGWKNKPTDYIIALSSKKWFDGKHCGDYVEIYYKGKTAKAKIADECPECSQYHIDMSQGLFEHFAALSVGEINLEWKYV